MSGNEIALATPNDVITHVPWSGETATVRLPIDGVGLGLLVIWVGALQIMLDKGKDLDWFHSGQIVILAIAAIVGLALFVVWELTDRHPVVDLRLFGRRNFWTSTTAMSLGYGTFFGNVVLLPLWLQQYMGYTATMAGMVLAPVGVLAILLTPIVGKNMHRVDPRVFATAAFAVLAIVLLMRSHFNTSADFATLLVPTFIQGAALAVFFIPLITLGLSGLTPDRIPAASGLFNFARITAGSFGTSIATTWWSPVTSSPFSVLCQGCGLVIVMLNVSGPLVSLPPFAVPPLSLRRTVTIVVPWALGAGVNVNLPLASMLGCVAKSALLSLVTLKLTV